MLWEGASLWTFDLPPVLTRAGVPSPGCPHAIQITLSADGPLRIHTENGRTGGPAVLIASDGLHACGSEGKVALLFVDLESRAGQALTQGMVGHGR